MRQAPETITDETPAGWRGHALRFLAGGDLVAGACLVLAAGRVIDGGAWFPLAVAVSCGAFLAAFVRDAP